MMLSAEKMGLPTQYRAADLVTSADLIIPVLALSFGPIATLTRYTRAELIEVLTSDLYFV